MGGKHLKRLRAEKSKVQLKKKKLLKGQNLTNTTFTVKKILTVEQLKKVDKDEPVSNWNVPLKDLLIKLSHYNFTSRLNSISGIKELVTKHPEVLKGPSFKPLINRLLERVTDEDHKIRMAATDLVSYLFHIVSPTSITPFYNILNVHLGCAMTHRNASVQQDSLKFLDVMIKHSSEALKHNFKIIAQNFLRIIKSYLHESHCGVFSSGKSKQDIEKAKREMLNRFYNFIVAGYSGISKNERSDCRTIIINTLNKKKISLRNLRNHYKKVPDLSLVKNSENKEKLSSDVDSVEFKSLCSLIIPLLFDTWIEFFPCCRFDENPSECVLTESVGDLLSVILKIFLFLYEKALELQNEKLDEWFTSTYSATFQKLFLSRFPYLPSTTAKKLKSSSCSDSAKAFYIFMTQNLLICHLAYSFKLVPGNSNLETKMEDYISGALTIKSTTENEILSKVIETAVSASKNQNINSLLGKVVEVYDTTSSLDLRTTISKILMKTALEESESITDKNQCIINWVKSIADRLCESHILVQEVQTALKLIIRSDGEEVLRGIENKAENIIENLSSIKIEGIFQSEGQKMIADILYRCSNDVLLGIITKKLLDKIHPEDLRNYISASFSQKLKSHLEIPQYNF